MQCTKTYNSPLGKILIAADDFGVTGLWFFGQKYFARSLENEAENSFDAVEKIFAETTRWLDIYFTGDKPDFFPPLYLRGTKFQTDVWQILRTIPYGKIVTYGEIASSLAKTSARAVGNAVGRNPISIIVPCHRVVGAGGKLTGYAGGLERKERLLRLEGIL